MFLFHMDDIWELGGSYKATKVIGKKHGLVYTEGLFKVGRWFDREVEARAAFDSNGNGGILSIKKNSDFKEVCKYFNDHAVSNLTIIENMQTRFRMQKEKFMMRLIFLSVAVFLILALICQFSFIFAGSIPANTFFAMKSLGAALLILSSFFLIREGMRIFRFNQYYL